MEALEIRISPAPDGTVISFIGIVDEQARFDTLTIQAPGMICFDLGGVTLLNSLGIRNWINWMKKMNDHSFLFRRCSRPIIDQVNIISGFLPQRSVIESIFVPYHCDSCENSEQILFSQGVEFTKGTADVLEKVTPPSNVVCSKCKAAMVMDVIEAKYFSFLRYRR
jgi:anti-anti-sigma regulatory factor